VTNAAADPHVCTLPQSLHTPNAEGAYVCPCGRRWHLEHIFAEPDGPYIGSSWILELDE
jgi:hypothetical protein